MNFDAAAPSGIGAPVPVAGELNAAIARATVQLWHSIAGRGPTKAYAFYRDNVFVVMMEETQTRAEKSLINNGQSDAVLRLRGELQTAIRAPLVEKVEAITGCTVVAFMSASHVDPDISTELFVLDRAVPGCAPDSGT